MDEWRERRGTAAEVNRSGVGDDDPSLIEPFEVAGAELAPPEA